MSHPLLLVIFPYAGCDPAAVKRQGEGALRHPEAAPKRHNAARALSYYAGRVAVATAFAHRRIRAFVEPVRDFGYLQVVDGNGRAQPSVFVNLSHTESIAVAILGRKSVGVDVESVKRDASRAIQRVAAPEELENIVGFPFPVDGQALPGELALWSAKEAVSKALGLGIKFGMHQFVIGLRSPGPPYPVRCSLSGPLSVHQPAVSFVRFEHYLIAICSEERLLQGGLEIVVAGSQRR